MGNQNDWIDENEKRESARRARAEFEYELYNQPKWVKKGSEVLAALLVLFIMTAILAGIIKGIWEIFTL